ncbi:hypothetical protein QZH41_018297, partial [Actinostola sp. cb2023]
DDVHNLLSQDEVEKVFGTSPSQVPEYDVTHPIQLNHRGDFLSHDVTNSNSDDMAKRNLHFQFFAFDKLFHLSVTLNTDQLLAPDFVTEIRNNGSSRYDKSIDHCHYSGHVVTPEGLGAKVAISNCDGLTGMIQSDSEVLMISPLPKRLGPTKRAHVVYRRSHGDVANMGRQLGLDVRSTRLTKKNQDFSDESDIAADDVANREYFIESLVVTDKNMVTFHGSVKVLKNYVLTLVNIVKSLMGNEAMGANIHYILNKLEILETDEPGLYINSHADRTLTRFCRWTTKQNTRRDSNKAHFDHAALISRTPFCSNTNNPRSPSCNSLLGLADLGGMCGRDTSCILSADTGLGTAFTIAHETGHNLGAEHDGEGNNCRDAVNIMARKASGEASGFKWSSCSKNYVTQFLSGSRSKCLKDKPGRSLALPTSLPGQDYSLDDQCKLMVKGSTGFCKQSGKVDTVCTKLWCNKGYSCETINEPAAEGSTCGKSKWCVQGLCKVFGKGGPKAVNGGYSAWTGYGECSHTCGGGVRMRSRKCNNPRPKNGGKRCRGESKEYKYCINKKCPSNVPHPRMTECQSKRNVKFEGGTKYNWVYNPKSSVAAKERCQLICEESSSFDSSFFNFGSVKNGDKCDGQGPKGVCIDGVCQRVGCDNVIGSTAKLDQCGVCKGTGTGCSKKTVRVSKVFDKMPDDDFDSPEYQTIAIIPVGARDIEIKELSSSDNDLAIETKTKKPILNMDMDYYMIDSNSDVIDAAGTKFYYTIRREKESVKAKGPLTEAIRIKVRMFYVYDWYTKYKVSYKYTTVSSSSRDVTPDSTGQFKWITKSKGCSVACGGGKSVVTAECVRVDDGSPVSHDLCDDNKPDDISTECNTHTCPASWSIGEWSDCSKTCNDGTLGQQSRLIMCVFKSNGEDELIDDSDCKEPKPAMTRKCGRRECPAEWVTVKTTPCSVTCGRGIIKITAICQKTGTSGQKRPVSSKECPGDDKPPSTLTCNTHIPCKA